MAKELSKDIELIYQLAGNQAYKYYHTWVGSSHLFLALNSFLSKNKTDARYGNLQEKLKSVLNKYGIDGKKFQEAFLLSSPKGEKPEDEENMEITVNKEFIALDGCLKRKAATEERTMEIEDFILELFNDKSYAIFSIFSEITKSDQITEQMYNDIIKTFKKFTKKADNSDLEKLAENSNGALKNLCSWVKEHPQTIIDADTVVSQMEVALAGRTIKNPALVGPAGTGKTAYVLELCQRINDGNVPEFLKDKTIYELVPSALVAGTRYRGKQNCFC